MHQRGGRDRFAYLILYGKPGQRINHDHQLGFPRSFPLAGFLKLTHKMLLFLDFPFWPGLYSMLGPHWTAFPGAGGENKTKQKKQTTTQTNK